MMEPNMTLFTQLFAIYIVWAMAMSLPFSSVVKIILTVLAIVAVIVLAAKEYF